MIDGAARTRPAPLPPRVPPHGRGGGSARDGRGKPFVPGAARRTCSLGRSPTAISDARRRKRGAERRSPALRALAATDRSARFEVAANGSGHGCGPCRPARRVSFASSGAASPARINYTRRGQPTAHLGNHGDQARRNSRDRPHGGPRSEFAAELQREQRVPERRVYEPSQHLTREGRVTPLGEQSPDRPVAQRADREAVEPSRPERLLESGGPTRPPGEQDEGEKTYKEVASSSPPPPLRRPRRCEQNAYF